MNARLRAALLALALFAGASSVAVAQQGLVGVWRLLSWVHAPQGGGDEVAPWGSNPMGFISYTAGGRMSAVVTAPERKASAANTQQLPTEEQAQLFRTVFAYAGSYSLEGDGVVLHHVEVASDPNWSGTHQRRFFKIEGNRLTITTPPLRILAESVARVHTLVWERVE